MDSFSRIADAPVFRPTAADFEDPMAYISSIRPIAEQSGICKIVPPANWRPAFKLPSHAQFTTRVQMLDGLEGGARCRNVFTTYVALLATAMDAMPVHDGCVGVVQLFYVLWQGQPWDLLALFKAMRKRGGFSAAHALNKAEWAQVMKECWGEHAALAAAAETASQTIDTKIVSAIYRKLLADFDRHLCRLSPDPRRKKLEAFYRQFNPERLAQIENILEDYPDHAELNEQLRSKYGVDLTDYHPGALLQADGRAAQQTSKPKAEPEPTAEPRPKAEPERMAEAEPAAAPKAQRKPKPEPAPEPKRQPGPEAGRWETLRVTVGSTQGASRNSLGLVLVHPPDMPLESRKDVIDAMHPLLRSRVLVASIRPGGRAFGCGIRELDVIASVDGHDVLELPMAGLRQRLVASMGKPSFRLELNRPVWLTEAQRHAHARALNCAMSTKIQAAVAAAALGAKDARIGVVPSAPMASGQGVAPPLPPPGAAEPSTDAAATSAGPAHDMQVAGASKLRARLQAFYAKHNPLAGVVKIEKLVEKYAPLGGEDIEKLNMQLLDRYACNFANVDWFLFGYSAVARYRRFKRDPVLPHYEFVFRIACAALRDPEKEGVTVVLALRNELARLIQTELTWRYFMLGEDFKIPRALAKFSVHAPQDVTVAQATFRTLTRFQISGHANIKAAEVHKSDFERYDKLK
eukprot:g2945.t1